jgi:hypothetical protein
MKKPDIGFNKNSSIVGENIVEHVKHVQSARDTMLNYFNLHSKLVRAVKEHVLRAADCALLDKGGREVQRLSRVYVEDVHALHAMPGACQMLNIRCVVTLRPLETDLPDYDLGTDIEKRMDICVPSDLELNFNTSKFNLWLSTIREKRARETHTQDMQKLKALVQRHPGAAKEIVAAFQTEWRQRKKRSTR